MDTGVTVAVTSRTALRRELRKVALQYGLPAETRARLVVSATLLADDLLTARRRVHLRTHTEHSGQAQLLTVTLGVPWTARAVPLPGEPAGEHQVVWRFPLPAEPPAPVTPAEAAEEEVALAVQHADALADELVRLKHELNETNRGVVALFVELDQRDEQLRQAHTVIFGELEAALRSPPPPVEGLELGVHYAPAGDDAPTGGDLYDWFTRPDGTLHVSVVDAIGHGVTSTRAALSIIHAVRTLRLEGHPLGSTVARAASVLSPTYGELMATLQLVEIDPRTGALRLANGGHPFPLVLRADGSAEYLEAWGSGVGFPRPGSDAVVTSTLGPGDLLLLYTDGLTESRRDMALGEKLLVESARRHAGLPLAELTAAIVADLHTVVLHADDTLLVAVRRQ